MDKRTVVGIAKRYKRAVVTAIGPAKVYLFGSYSKGCARPDSDIDIAVVVPRVTGDYYSASPGRHWCSGSRWTSPTSPDGNCV